MRPLTAALVLAFGLPTIHARVALAQPPPVGVRAAGMGGAFTAVADDATAVYWNPAGLASGAFVGITVDSNVLHRDAAQFFGLATPPLGLSYFRTTSTAPPESGRNGGVESFTVHHVVGTLVQSIGDHGLAVGTTLGAVHGNGTTTFAADAGVMLSGTLGHIGVTAHNLTAPALGGIRLDRQVRAGVAIHLRQDVLVASDWELLTANRPFGGEWRDAAVGVEAHPQARAWLRGGAHWNTHGSGGAGAAPIGTVGGSVAVYGSLKAEAQASFGSKAGDRGWGVGISFVY